MSFSNVPPTPLPLCRMISNRSCSRVYHRGGWRPGCTIGAVSALSNLLVNLWRLLGNARKRLFGRPPGFVWLEISGALPEFETPVGFLRRRFNRGPQPVTLQALRERLDRISSDGRVRGVVLRIKDVEAGWAALEEARGELLAFRRGGGRVVAYLADPVDTRSYYLA